MKKVKRALTDSEVRDMLRYYAHCQSLRDFIDEKVVASGMYYQTIKNLTNQLAVAIEKQIDGLLSANKDKDGVILLEQFINASVQADNLFETALKMELLDEDKKIECATKVSEILKQYNVE